METKNLNASQLEKGKVHSTDIELWVAAQVPSTDIYVFLSMV